MSEMVRSLESRMDGRLGTTEARVGKRIDEVFRDLTGRVRGGNVTVRWIIGIGVSIVFIAMGMVADRQSIIDAEMRKHHEDRSLHESDKDRESRRLLDDTRWRILDERLRGIENSLMKNRSK